MPGKKKPTTKSAQPASTKRPIEQYDHKTKTRINNPPVGLVTEQTDPPVLSRKTYAYDPHLDPQLVWAGKKEHTAFEVPTVSLHVHERIDPRTIIEAVRKRNGATAHGSAASRSAGFQPAFFQPSLFETKEENPPLREAVDFYRHAHNWTNRLIAGDSLLVMNSLLEKEGLAGQVQMVYIDPPYGIRYGSNFQPFVNRRDVKDGKDEDLTQEPEMVRAFRDTWELGIHSYLTYLRDRLLLARELLHESGSCFVQISDENLHRATQLLDEVFGSKNRVAVLAFKKTGFASDDVVSTTHDFLLWYCRDHEQLKVRKVYGSRELTPEELFFYDQIELADGTRRALTKDEKKIGPAIRSVGRPFARNPMVSPGWQDSLGFGIEFEGKTFLPPDNRHWSTSKEGIERLRQANRLAVKGNTLRFVRFFDDFPFQPLATIWNDTGVGGFVGDDRVYVVQTDTRVIERCILISSDPGDIVFDPTCGSGTTAYVAEQWGRRWITCDTSRVATTLAKQRLMSATFDYYKLAHPDEGVGSGFQYKKVPHVTLKSIANNEPPGEETLYDQPLTDNSRARISGPFTVEAVPAPNVKSLDELGPDAGSAAFRSAGFQPAAVSAPPNETAGRMPALQQPISDFRHAATPLLDASIARSGATLRQSDWRDELLKTGIRGKNNQMINFSRVKPLGGTRWLHADAETKGAKPERVVVSFGPDYAPLETRQVEAAWHEAATLHPKPEIIVFAAFQFDPEAAKDIDELTKEKTGMTFLTAQMNADLLTDDLKKKRTNNQSFWLVGRPDVEIRPAPSGGDSRSTGILPASFSGSDKKEKPAGTSQNPAGKMPALPEANLYVAEVRGFDYFNTRTGAIESGDTTKIAMWLLDTDYDGRSLYPRQVFFPLADEDEGWAKLARNLKAEIDPEKIEAYRGTISLPFELGEHKRVAIKVIDDRGIESLKVVQL